jgi:hypothetical protein
LPKNLAHPAPGAGGAPQCRFREAAPRDSVRQFVAVDGDEIGGEDLYRVVAA